MDQDLREVIHLLYGDGASLIEVSKLTGVPISTVRYQLLVTGSLRTMEQAIKLASERGKYGSGLRGKRRVFSQEHKNKIAEARRRWSEQNAKGVTLKPSGYLEYTTGPNKGRSVHVVKMEKKIGRSLLPSEVVHHKDEVRSNNKHSNLQLMTRSEHARHHNAKSIATRKRESNGRFK